MANSEDSRQQQQPATMADFSYRRHVEYFLDVLLEQLPSPYQESDPNRVTIAYFAISALDLLNALDQVPAKEVTDWVYALQVLPLSSDRTISSAINKEPIFGFRGSPSIGIRFNPEGVTPVPFDGGHLASTYSALSILRILDDDFSCVEHEAVLNTVRGLQQPDGSFCPVQLGAELDLRFTYCAAAICAMLDDWRGMDVDKACNYIYKCQSHDDGFGLSPSLEAHGKIPQLTNVIFVRQIGFTACVYDRARLFSTTGGGTYCALASLKLMGRLPSGPQKFPEPNLDTTSLVGWCLRRQTLSGGFQGRVNKDADTCYAFWVGSSLKILGAYDLCDKVALRSFLITCQTKYGGFSKFPNGFPDVLHSFYGICAFSLLEEPGLRALYCELGISMEASDGLPFLQSASKDQNIGES